MTRALLYLRQSDSDGDGERSLSMDSQATELYADAKRLGWIVVAELRDADLKGADERRPGLLDLYARCRAGSVDLVAFWKLDRLARSVRLQENVVHELDRLGVALHSVEEPWIADPFIRQILGSVAEKLTRDISANVRRAVRERTRRGLAHGPAPFGYERIEVGDEREPNPNAGKLTPSADADVLVQMFRWRAEGWSVTAIARRLIALGIPSPMGRVWTRPTVESILANPVYRGRLRLADVEIAGAHPALVDDGLWQRAHATCTGPRSRAPKVKPASSWLEGLIEHACGEPMYLVGGSPGRPPMTFRCRIGGGWGPIDARCPFRPSQMPLAQAERMVWEVITEALVGLPSLADVWQRAKREYQEAIPLADVVQREALRCQKQAQERRERVLESFWSGRIERPRLEAEMARVDALLLAAASVLTDVPIPPDRDAIAARLATLRDLRDALPRYDEEERASVLHALGVAVIHPAGYRVGRADAGIVTIRYRPELRHVFAE